MGWNSIWLENRSGCSWPKVLWIPMNPVLPNFTLKYITLWVYVTGLSYVRMLENWPGCSRQKYIVISNIITRIIHSVPYHRITLSLALSRNWPVCLTQNRLKVDLANNQSISHLVIKTWRKLGMGNHWWATDVALLWLLHVERSSWPYKPCHGM